MSREQQEQLGLRAAAEVYKQMPVLPDSSPVTKYVQELGTRLYKTIPLQYSWPFQFHVIAQKEINAFALPGGPMFVNLGLITAADNEAELAGVMGHEMAHVYMQHSAKQQGKASTIGGLAAIAGAIAGIRGGAVGALAQTGIQVGAGTLMLKYSRNDESQADSVGAIILWKAGYDPVAMANFFDKLAAQSGGSGPEFLNSHPNPGNRKLAIQREIAEWPVKPYRRDNSEFERIKNDAATLPAYSAKEIAAGAKRGRWAAENRKNGAIFPGSPRPDQPATVPYASLSDVMPSSTIRTADLGFMKINRPDNWPVMRGRLSDSVILAPKAGVAGGTVAYGVVLQFIQVREANIGAMKLTAAVAQDLQATDANMKQIGEIQPVTVNGAPAGSVELGAASPMPDAEGEFQDERDWLIAVPRGKGRGIVFVFVSTQAHFDEMKPTFDYMLRSVRF